MEKPTGPTPPEKHKHKATTTGRIGPITALGACVVTAGTLTLGCTMVGEAARTFASVIRTDGKAEDYAEAGHPETARQDDKLADYKEREALFDGLFGGAIIILSGVVFFAVVRARRPEDEPHPDAPSAASIPNLPLE